MQIRVKGAREHNLKSIDVTLGSGLTAVTGVSGSGKTSLVFDTLYHESRRRFQEVFAFGSPRSRLSPARVDAVTGLGPAAAVGQNLLNRNPNSTLASASGLHPFFRLLYARFGQRRCRKCSSPLSILSEDEIVDTLERMSRQTSISVCAPLLNRALGSHRTLLRLLSTQFPPGSLLVDGIPWTKSGLDPAKPHRIEIEIARLEGPPRVSRLREVVRTVKALGSSAVILRGDHLAFTLSFTPVCVECGEWFGELAAKHFHQACPFCSGRGCAECAGLGLYPEAASVSWQDLKFPELLAKSVEAVHTLFKEPGLPYSAQRLRVEIQRRLEALDRVGLGYISLDRPSPSLSRGESQRVRLAVALTSRLEDILHVLDEPSIGLHPADVSRLIPAFRELAGPVVYVEHDRAAVAFAHRVIDLGPGAGNSGGEIVFTGTPAELWKADTLSARYFSLRERVQVPMPANDNKPPARRAIKSFDQTFSKVWPPAGPPEAALVIKRAFCHNLQQVEVKIPLGRLTVVTGVSGSGKSTLVEDVLAASLERKKPVGCVEFQGPWLRAVVVDQSPIGKNPRSTPATYTKLSDLIRDLYAEATGLSASHFSFNRPEGACPGCSGMGAVEIRLRFLPSAWIPCEDCQGLRFNDEVLEKKVSFGDRGLSIAEFYDLTVAQAFQLLPKMGLAPGVRSEIKGILETLLDIGLGYLPLGQPSPTLSGGEAQRVKLAKYLGSRKLADNLIILDEPSTGLHPCDLAGLLRVLAKLVQAGATIVVVEHNPDMIRAAGWIIDLGPGAGPAGGNVVYMGTVPGLLGCRSSLTGQALREESRVTPNDSAQSVPAASPVIKVRGARAHNLENVDVDFPKNSLTVVTGVSGSGKSSLVRDVLEAEAKCRFFETLSMYERQGIKEGPEAAVDSVTGLGVCLPVTPDRKLYDRRSTVGTAAEIWHHLAILLSTMGERTCQECGSGMTRGDHWTCPGCGAEAEIASPNRFSPFTYAAACTTCQGVGTLQVPCEEKLIRNPGKPLCGGAMYSPGFFPKGYLCKPGNGGYDMVQAFARRYGFDPEVTPWEQIPQEVRQKFLFGDPEPMEVTFTNPRGMTHNSVVKFPGFYGWIRDWDVGGTYTDSLPCPDCNGAKLRPQYLAVTLAGFNIHQLSELPLSSPGGGTGGGTPSLLWPCGPSSGSLNCSGGGTPNRLWPCGPSSGSLNCSPQAFKTCPKDTTTNHQSPTDRRWQNLEILNKRLRFLEQVGLGYLHLNRITATLSAGEAQRVKLAGLLGSGLTSLTILLDEPTRGLHPREVGALVEALKELRDEGNTVIIVEHDAGVIRAADHIIDVGPLAGTGGGRIVAAGPLKNISGADTVTGAWLRGERQILCCRERRLPQEFLSIKGARENNLKGDRIQIPRRLLVGICGVSGSGKSTLMIDTLGRALVPATHTTSVAREPLEPGKYDEITGAPARVLLVDQTGKGIHSPAAFLGLVQPLLQLYAESETARSLGLDMNALSTRCSVCRGSGWISLDMDFLPAVNSECESCAGTGYAREYREVKYQGYSLPEVNRMTIDEVYRLLAGHEKITGPLKTAIDVGLGYLVLKQPGISLSGGEIQRLKIAAELRKKNSGETLYILDEPTVGQHLEDVCRLSGVLHELVEEGNSVVVIEHHPHLLASCDWLLELGPGGGPEGGRLIAAGPPETIADMNTPTAPYLQEVLEAGK